MSHCPTASHPKHPTTAERKSPRKQPRRPGHTAPHPQTPPQAYAVSAPANDAALADDARTVLSSDGALWVVVTLPDCGSSGPPEDRLTAALARLRENDHAARAVQNPTRA